MRLQVVALVTFATSALAAPAPRPWCMRPAQPCWKLKRAVEAFNDHAADNTLPPTSEEAVVEERATTTDLDLFAASAYDHLVHLAAQASPDPESFYEQHRLHHAKRDNNQLRCAGGDDTACWARGAAQAGEVEKRWCMRPAQPCWKTRRAAEAVLDAGQEGGGAQEACGVDDDECANAKRHLDGLHRVAREIVNVF